MQFKGRLRLPDDSGAGIPVDLRLDDIFLVLVAEGETLGEWRMDDVGIRRVFSNQFLLDLEGEEMVFVADDPLGFAYEGVAEIEATTQRLSKRWRGRKKKRRAEDSTSVVVDTDRVDADRAKERRTAAAESTAPSAAPVVEPPSPAQQPSAEPTPQPEPAQSVDIAPFDPPSPQAPVVEPAAVRSDPVLERPAEKPVATPGEPDPSVEPIEQFTIEPIRSVEPVEQSAIEAASAVPPNEPDAAAMQDVPVYEEPAFEVEEVVVPAATSAFAVVEDKASEPEPVVAPEDDGEEFVAVEPATPGVAAVAEVAPLLEDHAPPEVGELPAIGAGLDAALSEPEAMEAVPDAASESSLRSAAAAARAAQEDEQASRAEVVDDTVDDDAPRHLRERKPGRRSRRSRRKRPEVGDHEHTYEEKSAVGGIIRRVCSQCGHVSFGSEDVYEDWGA